MKLIRTKDLEGRGRIRERWLIEVEADLVGAFILLRKLGVQFSTVTLETHARDVIKCSKKDKYNPNMRSGKKTQLIVDLINLSWVKRLINRQNIVMRRKTGNIQISSEAQCHI